MKKKNILLPITALISVLALNTGLYLSSNNEAIDVNAYTTSSLPTTINLNDCSEQEIRSYYSSLNSLSTSERQGTNLLKNLKPILKNNQKYLSYDSGSSIWDVYCIVDRDWNKSPASALPTAAGTYNASTNQITNYKWGGNSATYENPYLHALYYNRENEPVAQAYGDHGNGVNNPTGINREHIWPKGAGFDTSGAGGARGDIMHLWAAHGHTNNKHSNYYYGYVDKTKTYKDEATDTAECAGNLLGYSKTLGGTTYVFEPQDSDKGDIARACFYMVARYNNLANDDTIDSNNPNLELVNNLSSFSNSGYTSTSTSTGKLGILQDLLDWNRLDPPDEFEIHRNNLCYNNFTNNRNPFIDFPSWADAIWGTVDSNGNYDATVTKSASPNNDPINAVVGDSFSISDESLELNVGETAEISANNANGNISWTVTDNTVISLNKTSTTNEEVVTITALKSGTTTITATNGSNSVTCLVTVTEPLNYGTLENPLTVDEAIALISITGSNATAEQIYVKGIVSSNSAYNTTYSNYDYVWLTNDDGLTSQALELYRVTASDDIKNTYGTANSMVDNEIVAHGYGMYYNNTTYELTKSNNISPEIISIIEPPTPSAGVEYYINKATSVAELRATETSTSSIETNSIVFSELNLKNGVQYSDPFDAGSFTVTFTGGGNDGKYYTTGSGIRIYGDGSVIITAKNGNISKLVLAFDGTYTPTSGDVVNTGTYDLSTSTWTGSATSVQFTRPSGTGHWRLQSISATCDVETITVDEVKLDFGFDIAISDWEAINDLCEITDYGLMLFKTTKTSFDSLTPVQDAFEAGYTPAIIHEGTTPLIEGDSGYYSYRGTVNIPGVDYYDKTFMAAPFIYADEQYYFFTERQESVYSLAEYYKSNSGCELSNSALLTILANKGE